MIARYLPWNRRMRRALVSCMRGLGLALLLTACDASIDGRICLLGDSNAEYLLPALHFTASHGHLAGAMFVERERSDMVVPVAAVRGARLDWGLMGGFWAGRLATSGVDCTQAVISLGTNDLLSSQGAVGSEIDGLMDALLSIPELEGVPVLWIAPNTPLEPERVDDWRMALWRAEQRWPQLEVQDAPTAWLDEGQVHYTEQGYAELAAAVSDRLLGMVP